MNIKLLKCTRCRKTGMSDGLLATFAIFCVYCLSTTVHLEEGRYCHCCRTYALKCVGQSRSVISTKVHPIPFDLGS
jgi:hypothetical protein